MKGFQKKIEKMIDTKLDTVLKESGFVKEEENEFLKALYGRDRRGTSPETGRTETAD